MTQTVVAAAMGFGQSSEVFVPMAMVRGHRRADIKVVVGYQLVWCIYPTIRPSQHSYEAPSSGAGQDRETDVWCFTLAYAFPNRKVKSGVGKLREGSLSLLAKRSLPISYHRRVPGFISAPRVQYGNPYPNGGVGLTEEKKGFRFLMTPLGRLPSIAVSGKYLSVKPPCRGD